MYRIFYHRAAYNFRGTLDWLIWRGLSTSGTKQLDTVKAEMTEYATDDDWPNTILEFRLREPDVTEVWVKDDKEPNLAKLATIFTGSPRKVFYSPFGPQCETYTLCEGLFEQEGGLAVEFSRPKVLAKYGKDVSVIVVGHGDRSAGRMTCDCQQCGQPQWDGKFGYTPGELWDRLKRDGLVSNVKTLKLHMCLGADAPDKGGMSFAAQFNSVITADASFDSSGTRVVSYHGYLTMTRNGSFSYTKLKDDNTKAPAKERKEVLKQRKP